VTDIKPTIDAETVYIPGAHSHKFLADDDIRHVGAIPGAVWACFALTVSDASSGTTEINR
jgi:hypothetical protein